MNRRILIENPLAREQKNDLITALILLIFMYLQKGDFTVYILLFYEKTIWQLLLIRFVMTAIFYEKID